MLRAVPPPPRKILVLIPAYNEEDRIGPTLRQYATYFEAHGGGRVGILVIVNGSRDNTLGVVQGLSTEFPSIRWIEIPERVGKGGALIEGLRLASEADVIGYADADGATTPASLLALAEHCREYDCVVGSRRVAGAQIRQFQSPRRRFASAIFHLIVETLFHMGIHDTQCGAKFLRREMVEQIHDELLIADMAFDVNLLYAVRRARGRILEAPVDWTDQLGSTVRYFRTSLVMFLSVVRLRLVHSPFRAWLRPLRPLEARIYRALRNPPPRSQTSPHARGPRSSPSGAPSRE